MNVIIEILLWAIILLGLIFGAKYGFVRLTAKPVKFIAALLLAFNLCALVAETIISPMIHEPVFNYISDFMHENCPTITVENAADELPTILKISAAVFGIDIEEVAAVGGESIIDSIINALTTPVINVIALILSFFAVYFLAKLLLSLVIWLINGLCSGGVIGIVNKILGFVSGGVVAFALSWAVAVIVELIFHLPAFETSEAVIGFEGGPLYQFFNTYNPIELLLSF